jgi:hypothetical protein
VAYIAAADFRLGGLKPWTSNLVLTEADGTNANLDLVIASVSTQVELDLNDDFDPPSPDNDETIDVFGSGTARLYMTRRVRALTTVNTRAADGTLTAQASTLWRLQKSLNTAGTAMTDGAMVDYLEVIYGKSLLITGWAWPYGTQTVQLVGKFGWSAPPDDIKRLVALRVYGMVKAKADPLTTITQRSTIDAVVTFGPSAEETQIVDRYTRPLALFG